MNEQAIIDSYILFKNTGYSKSLQDFKKLISSNSDALNDVYILFRETGYTKSLNDYKILMGVGAQQNPTQPNPTIPTTSVFGCVEAVHKSRTGKAYTSDKSQLHITREGGIKHVFINNYSFIYLLGNGRKSGKWACDGVDNYIITLLNGQTWSSKDPKWSEVPPTTPTPSTGNTTTITNTTLTADDLVKGGLVKLGMKGDIVGKIQELLISKGHKDISRDGKVDKIFGRRTKKMVKDFQSANDLNDDGVVGPLTWGKLSDPSLTTAQSDAAKSQLPVNHGKREIDDGGNPFVYDGYAKNWIPDSEYLKLYNTDGTKKLQENIIKNIVGKNLHSLL
jgi:hypothetical protein